MRWEKKTVVASFFFFVAVVLLNWGSSLGVGWASSQPSTAKVMMDYWAPYYRPAQAVVPAGEPVRVVNPTSSPHTMTHEGCRTSGPCAFDTGAVHPGKAFIIPPLPPGRYPYYCVLHPIMTGEIIVLQEKPVMTQTAKKNHEATTLSQRSQE